MKDVTVFRLFPIPSFNVSMAYLLAALQGSPSLKIFGEHFPGKKHLLLSIQFSANCLIQLVAWIVYSQSRDLPYSYL